MTGAYATARRGEAHYAAILTDSDVRLIRELGEERARLIAQARTLTNRAIAAKFGVGRHTIERVLSGERWSHV